MSLGRPGLKVESSHLFSVTGDNAQQGWRHEAAASTPEFLVLDADTLTGTQLVHLLADVVAHGGNLLINVGPDGAGHIPDLQQRPLRELGAWLDHNGDAIYATRPWSTAAATTADGHQVRYTHKDGTVFAIVLADQLTGTLTIRGLTLPPGSRVGILNGPRDLAWVQTATDVRITPPPQPPGRHAHVLTITANGQARGRIGGPR
jgi:alpha-L-fucosidase